MVKKLKTKEWLVSGGILVAVILGGWLWWNKNKVVKPGMSPGQFGPGQELTEKEREEMRDKMMERMEDEGLSEGEIELRLEQGPRGGLNGERPGMKPVEQ